MPLLLITIDTNIVDPKEVAPLEAVLTDIPHEIGFGSVTEREHGYEIGYLGRRVTESERTHHHQRRKLPEDRSA